jgi:hypothetical protein
MTDKVKAEKDHRLQLWERLRVPGETRGVEPSILRNAGIYGGAQGVWVDPARTSSIVGEGKGITVSLLHTGSSYADDLSEDGLIYHYPRTKRPAGRDISEIEAPKAAGRLGLPVFVVCYPTPSSALRRIRLGWVEDWDDESRTFLVSFGSEPHSPTSEESGDPFSVFSEDNRSSRLSFGRRGQQRFKFLVAKRCGQRCAACGISIPELLEACHIAEKGNRGTDDPRNGLILCATHHRAFDSFLFTINPETTTFEFRIGGPSGEEMNFKYKSLAHLPKKPHPLALKARWEAQGAKRGGLVPIE